LKLWQEFCLKVEKRMIKAREVERIRTMYADRDQAPAVQAMWAALAEMEVAYRIQQLRAMATLLRSTGRLELSDLRILDVGCGQGRLLRACLDMGASPQNLSGVDVRSNAIEEAHILSPHLDFRISNGIDLDWPDGQFDLVMQFVVFSSIFMDDLRRHLASEMMRVLKPGGYESLFRFMVYSASNERRQVPWPVYGSPISRPVLWRCAT
jgi:ubiquinone/menaquinone biosynthesis C-methylase UbiE